MLIGIDFGLSVTDAVLVSDGRVRAHAALRRPGPASVAVLGRAVAALPEDASSVGLIGVTGGRSLELPDCHGGARIVHVAEPSAVGRGGLALAGLERALVVSCGTGTAMIAAHAPAAGPARFSHLTGTAVGGGTLEGLGAHLLGVRNASEVAALALRGNAAAVDTTLSDVLAGGVGNLPADATAVNLGRLAELREPRREDLAAGLTTMVAQTIALIAINGARAHAFEEVVFIGRLAEHEAIRAVVRAVFAIYGVGNPPRFPAGAAYATAYGAALLLPR